MKKNKKIIIIIAVLFVINTKVAFATNRFSIGLDSKLMNTYLAEDESQNKDIINVVNNFVYGFITQDMSDFEKEMQIIKYLVATITYAEEEELNQSFYINDSYKAYGALVNHRATCSGYAKAFDLLAKHCDLSSTIVTGVARNSSGIETPHAWNQIYIDGDWYNVDVTWEDPKTNIEVGFNQLFNKYINGTDIEFAADHVRENGNVCTATKYGKATVAAYLNTGLVNINANLDIIRKSYEKQIADYILAGNDEAAKSTYEKLFFLGAKYDDNSNYFPLIDDVTLNAYILTRYILGDRIITFVTGPNTENQYSIDSNNWIKNNMQIEGKISLHRIFLSDGTYDIRILIFS